MKSSFATATSAAIAGVTREGPAPPWYRHRWPWLLMLGPVIVVVAGFATLWLAIASDDGLVADDYYKRGLGINRTLARGDRAQALQLAATVDVDPLGNARVLLETPSSEPAARPATLSLRLTHPTHAGLDRRAELTRGPDGSYTGQVASAPPGRWIISVETDDWRLPATEVDGALRGVHLGARPDAAPRAP